MNCFILFSPDLASDSLRGIQVGVMLSGTRRQRHVTLLYRESVGGPVEQIGFGWDCLITQGPVEGGGVWGLMPLDEEEHAGLTAYLLRVAAVNDGRPIPYGLDAVGQEFDRAGAWAGRSLVGLTCATFVKAVLLGFGRVILDDATWQLRQDDTRWQGRIHQGLRNGGASEEFLTAQEQNVGRVARFRPEEVAAAAASEDIPLGFAQAEPRGREWVDALTQVA